MIETHPNMANIVELLRRKKSLVQRLDLGVSEIQREEIRREIEQIDSLLDRLEASLE